MQHSRQTPSPEDIAACLAHFEEIAPKIRQHDAFGGSNRAKIDAQIEVLTYPGEWEDDNAYADDRGLDVDDDCELLRSVQAAIDWLNGEYDEEDGPFSKDWDSLIVEAQS